MKILHIISRLNKGGTSTWLNTLTKTKLNEFEQYLCFGKIDSNELEDTFYKTRKFKKLKYMQRPINSFFDFLAFFELRKVIRQINPQIINTHTFKAGLIGRLAARSVSKKIKVIHTFHGHLIYGYYGTFLSRMIITIEKLLSHLTDEFIVNGTQVKKDLIKNGIGNKKKFTVINPGVEIPKKSSNKIYLRQKFKISSQSIVIGWLGRLSDIKNPLLVKEIARELPDQIFLIGGEGELRKDLEFDAPKNFYLLGWVKPERFWPMCDIALLTSKNEATPYALVEAASFGLPIVASNVGSVSDIVKSKNGFLVEEKDSYVKSLRKMVRNKKLSFRMGIESKHICNTHFSIKQFQNKHEEVYNFFK
jgi:glycosyltransferase involved in cell wall biosynthesis